MAILSQKRKIGGLRETVIGALERRLQAAPDRDKRQRPDISEQATEALRNSDRMLERAQGESFFLTKKISKMQRAIIDVAAERIATALVESDNSDAPDAGAILSQTLNQMIAEPVAATLRSLEQPRMLSLLGKSVLASHVRRKLETDYDRTLLEFLSLYANRLRRWMEQSINAMRNAFAAFADMHRAHFEAAPAVGETADASAVKGDLRILREWDRADKPTVISNI